jgi:galactofuranose transport system permease protein
MENRMIDLKNITKNEQFRRLFWPMVSLSVIILFNIIFTKGFLNIEIRDGHLFGSMIDILNRGAPIILISIGMTLVYATAGIDLSVGSVIAISGAIAAQIIRPGYIFGILEYPDPPASLFFVIAIPLIVSMLAGLWNGFLVAIIGIQPIIATLILMVAGRGIAQLITLGQITIFIHEDFQFIGSGFFLGLHFPIILMILIILLTYIFTRKTALGMFIEATGANVKASRYMGIKTKLNIILTYVFCALCAGIAGLIICADIKASDANHAGLFYELDAIASVIIGGTIWGGRFTLAGSVIGALIIQSITTTILTFGIPPEVNMLFKAIVIIVVALIQSEALRDKLFNLGTKLPKIKADTK